MLGVPWVGVESWCEGGGAGTKTVRVMCTGVDDISGEPATFQELFKRGRGVMKLEWSPLHPTPPLAPSFLI